MTVMYRYEDVRYAGMLDGETGEFGRGHLEVHLREFSVVRKTPKGTWIAPAYVHVDPSANFAYLKAGGVLRFVLDNSRKRFACPTVDEARASFVARKKAQIRIYEERINDAKRALVALEIGRSTW